MPRDITRRDFLASALAASSAPLLQRMSTHGVDTRRALSSRLQDTMDRDLLEVTVPRLQALYDSGKYSAVQVTQWHLNRIAKYDSVYRALVSVDTARALAAATTRDAEVKAGRGFRRGPLWGVPIVIKANMSVKGLVTSAGWSGYVIPGHELVAPMDATVVAKLRAAGAIILGQTNLPDFAYGDTTVSTAFGRTGNAYDARFSPGGSSGGTVTAVAANFCVIGTGTDTGNSIRTPSSTSALVGFLPTRGLVSIAGIHPSDWLLDNVGPIARNVTDAAIALDVMAGEDDKDFQTKDSATQAQHGPYRSYLRPDALAKRRFGVPAFMMKAASAGSDDSNALRSETRTSFMRAIEGLRAAGATVVFDDSLLPESFMDLVRQMNTRPYRAAGVEDFLRDYGPAEYHSANDYARAVGSPLPASIRTAGASRRFDGDPRAERVFWEPRRNALAAYDDALSHFQLDGLVYPAAQMPPPDETIPQRDGRPSDGVNSYTWWANVIGVPAVVAPGGFYANGLPFGLELSARRWHDGDLLGWAYAYEQATKYRRPPLLVSKR